jgi:hypothetical protein
LQQLAGVVTSNASSSDQIHSVIDSERKFWSAATVLTAPFDPNQLDAYETLYTANAAKQPLPEHGRARGRAKPCLPILT